MSGCMRWQLSGSAAPRLTSSHRHYISPIWCAASKIVSLWNDMQFRPATTSSKRRVPPILECAVSLSSHRLAQLDGHRGTEEQDCYKDGWWLSTCMIRSFLQTESELGDDTAGEQRSSIELPNSRSCRLYNLVCPSVRSDRRQTGSVSASQKDTCTGR